jgi:hypothetical protein
VGAGLRLALVQAGLMNGKSVGYIATQTHAPTTEEHRIRRRACLRWGR